MNQVSPTRPIKNRYKTLLCKNWLSGFCEFGEKCVFAHGAHEKRGSAKTRKCRQFFDHGFCMFGEKCMFLHYTDFMNSSPLKARLPVFTKICDISNH